MRISEIITDKYKLRIPPSVYYDLLADVQELEEEEEPTSKSDLAVDKEQLKTMIRGLTKWYVKRDNTEVGEPNTAVGLLYDDVMFGIDRLPLVTSQEPRKGKWIDTNDKGFEYHRIYKCSNCEYTICAYPEEIKRYKFCYGCGSRNEVEK